MARLDYFVDVASAGRDVGIVEFLGILGNQLFAPLVGIGGLLNLATEEDIHRAFRSHDRYFGGRPGVVDIAAHMLAAHDIVCATISLARDYSDLGHGGLTIGVEQLGAVTNNAVMLLS